MGKGEISPEPHRRRNQRQLTAVENERARKRGDAVGAPAVTLGTRRRLKMVRGQGSGWPPRRPRARAARGQSPGAHSEAGQRVGQVSIARPRAFQAAGARLPHGGEPPRRGGPCRRHRRALPRICPIPGRGSAWQGDQHDSPTGPGVLHHCDGLHPNDPVAQRVSRRRQSERYATKTGCCRDCGLGRVFPYGRCQRRCRRRCQQVWP
jgi:hypothetical protein